MIDKSEFGGQYDSSTQTVFLDKFNRLMASSNHSIDAVQALINSFSPEEVEEEGMEIALKYVRYLSEKNITKASLTDYMRYFIGYSNLN